MAKYDFEVIKTSRGIYNRFKLEGLDAMWKDLERMAGEFAGDECETAAINAMKPVEARVRGNIIRQDIPDTGSLLKSVRLVGYNPNRLGRAPKRRKGLRGASVMAGVSGRHRSTYKRDTKSGFKKGDRKPVYALQNEFGTTNPTIFGIVHPERPFMRPAFDGHEVSIGNAFRDELKRRVAVWKYKINTGRGR